MEEEIVVQERVLEEQQRELEEKIVSSGDFVVVARVKASECDYKKIRSALFYLFKKAGVIE